MAEVFHEDVVEQILIHLDANDLIRYKRVCKSWHSLITSPRFIYRHLSRSYYNNELGHRRITLFTPPSFIKNHRLVGSSNGLVCISSFLSKLIVGNPLTREIRQLEYPQWVGVPLGWGFGYDLSKDDYKVIVGTRNDEDQIFVRVLSLKSNVWTNIGVLKYRWFETKEGVLCNGALNWIVSDESLNKFIISYDLSTDEFKEMPQPDDARYEIAYGWYLGVFKECLCVIRQYDYSSDVIWLMKEYKVKESWALLPLDHVNEMKCDMVHFLRLGLPKDKDASWFCRASEHLSLEYMDAPIYVQSLVSPHYNARTKRFSSMLSKRIPHVVGLHQNIIEAASSAAPKNQRPTLPTTHAATQESTTLASSAAPKLMREEQGSQASRMLMKELNVITFILFLSLSLMFLLSCL